MEFRRKSDESPCNEVEETPGYKDPQEKLKRANKKPSPETSNRFVTCRLPEALVAKKPVIVIDYAFPAEEPLTGWAARDGFASCVIQAALMGKCAQSEG